MGKSEHAQLWGLEQDSVFLNHGSYGASPLEILKEQSRWRARIESQPVRFYKREYQSVLADSKAELKEFIGASEYSLAMTTNATTAVNTVLRNLQLSPGDEIVLSDFTYPACRNAIAYYAKKAGAILKFVPILNEISSNADLLSAFKAKFSDKTRLVFLDHVSSPLGIIFPINEIIASLGDRRPTVLVDGAHAPGMLDLNLDSINCDYYIGNLHKWLCAPKSGAFLACRESSLAASESFRGMIIGHGSTALNPTTELLLQDTDWPGTFDPSPILCIPKVLKFFRAISGTWIEHYQRNHQMILEAYKMLCERLDLEKRIPDSHLGSMAPLFLGNCVPLSSETGLDPLQDELYEKYKIEVPLINWQPAKVRILRISAQLYNSNEDYLFLAKHLNHCNFYP